MSGGFPPPRTARWGASACATPTYALDGLFYHESDLRIAEHSTNTAGFTDHMFGLMHLLGFRFAPRLRDLKETKLYLATNKET